MDEKGYAFTPLVFLLFIPIMILAVSYGNIVEEINTISTIALGGDVTHDTAVNIYTAIEKGTADAGRNAAFNATKKVIDDRVFLSDSRNYIKNVTVISLNSYVTSTCKNLENNTGREIYINNIPITNYTQSTFTANNITISQEDPYGFYAEINAGIPIKIVQRDQVYEGRTPKIKVYVSIEQLEDPYIYLNTKERKGTSINRYTNLTSIPFNYHFADIVTKDMLYSLWECLNGTTKNGEIIRGPLYFPDKYGLSFFDRLENKTNTTSTSSQNARLSTFVLGDPLFEEHGFNGNISRLDHEYFAGILGTSIKTKKGAIETEIREPDSSGLPNGPIFYLSNGYKIYLGLAGSPYIYS